MSYRGSDEDAKKFAMRNGYKFIDRSADLIKCDESFSIHDFTTGHSFYSYSVIMGKKGEVDFQVMHYSYIGKAPKSPKHNFTVCLLHKPGFAFPKFFMRKEEIFFDYIGEKLGYQDIDFVEDKTFSDKFVLQGENENKIRSFFNGRVRKAFVDVFGNKYTYEASGEASGEFLMVYVSGYLSFEKRQKMLFECLKLFDAITLQQKEETSDKN